MALGGVIFCYCTAALCFQEMAGEEVIIEEYGGSKGLDVDVANEEYIDEVEVVSAFL